jgi:hypothetical protein
MADSSAPQINNTDVAVDEGTIQVLTITASDADNFAFTLITPLSLI